MPPYLSDREERALQRRHEEQTAFPLLTPGWTRRLALACRHPLRRVRPPVPSGPATALTPEIAAQP